ncbi:MAG: DUF3786 domain-containing protein, partial [Nitrospirota bacterium]
ELPECRELKESSQREIEEMLSGPGDWKERRVKELFDEISTAGFYEAAPGIGAIVEDDRLRLAYFGREITLGRTGFQEEIDVMDRLLILMYIRQAGRGELTGKWTAFREFKDGLIRSESFHDACEMPLAEIFERKQEGLIRRLADLGAEKTSGFATEYSYIFRALPKLPMLVLLWPGDEEIGANCKILLDSTAHVFLDIEALLYLGMALVRHIKQDLIR